MARLRLAQNGVCISEDPAPYQASTVEAKLVGSEIESLVTPLLLRTSTPLVRRQCNESAPINDSELSSYRAAGGSSAVKTHTSSPSSDSISRDSTLIGIFNNYSSEASLFTSGISFSFTATHALFPLTGASDAVLSTPILGW